MSRDSTRIRQQDTPHAFPARAPIAVLLALFAVISAIGCAPEPEPLEMETVELGAGPTDQLTADNDAVESATGSSGLALPADFPEGLPIPPSASLLASARGRATFGTEDPLERARAQLERELQRTGWAPDGEDRFVRDGQSVRITFEPQAERTLVVIRY